MRTVDERADKVDNDQMSVITQYKLMCYYVGGKVRESPGLGGGKEKSILLNIKRVRKLKY